MMVAIREFYSEAAFRFRRPDIERLIIRCFNRCMSEANEAYAYFTITGSFDPDIITQRLATAPSDAWREGDLNPRNGHARKFSRWSLRSRLERTASLEFHVEDVLDQMDARSAAFKEISAEAGGVMQLVAYFHSSYPGLSFEREIIQRLSEYRLSMDCDFYYLYSDRREDTE